tara:strand:- start:4207 stop:4359 length:153 start_codon:yes stop_codon:yes gene_type:complete
MITSEQVLNQGVKSVTQQLNLYALIAFILIFSITVFNGRSTFKGTYNEDG